MAVLQVSPQVVGNAFVQQYYHIQHQSPWLVHRFYQDSSKVGRPEDDGTMSITTTMDAINKKILSLNYGEYRAEIKSVDSQESHEGGVHVLVTGYLAGKDNLVQNFTQTFFLAPQEKGYFVLNDMFRYVEGIKQHGGNQSPVDNVKAPLPPEQDPSPVLENHVSVQTLVSIEVNEEEVLNHSDNEQVSVMVEEEPVAEDVDEVPDDSQMAVEAEANSKIEEVPKKSYASIVMDMKDGGVPVSSPATAPTPAPRRTVAKSQELLVNPAQASVSEAETPFSGSDAIENGNNKEGEAIGYSVYIKGLPTNTTHAQLEEEFKRFGPIKSGGVQVRSKPLGFSFGFVEFEAANAVQEAIEASPITIGGRKAFVEEKRSTYTPGNRGHFSTGGGSGFRNEVGRGRGNYGSGRGYSRGDFNGRTEFGNRGSNRGGFPNRGANGYERTDSMGSNGGGRSNRGGGMAVNGTAKTMVPRVSATA